MLGGGGKLLYHSNSGGKGVGLLIYWDLGVTSGGGVATWGIMFLGQLWWYALLDMGLLVTPLQPNKILESGECHNLDWQIVSPDFGSLQRL